jgi:hypothetical protein
MDMFARKQSSRSLLWILIPICIIALGFCKKESEDNSLLMLTALTSSWKAPGGNNPVRTLAPLKTYQTQCWDSAGVLIACAGTGQDGEYQAGRTADFTVPTAHGTYTNDYTTEDNATGLVWKTCSEGLSGPGCTGTVSTMDWVTATGTGSGCDALNSLNSGVGYAGRSGWRMPTVEELEILINYSASGPAAFATSFPATVANIYWSASTYVSNTTVGWGVHFLLGGMGFYNKASNYYVRCVSSGVYNPARLYTVNGDGTVTDRETGLLWEKCSMGQNNDAGCSGTATTAIWTDALSYCNGLTLAGRTWRLPNINELKSIADRTISNPAIEATSFPATVANYYWSASTSVASTASAWLLGFVDGGSAAGLKTGSHYARCVSGP